MTPEDTLFLLSSATIVKLSLPSLCFGSYSAIPRWLPLHSLPLFPPFCLQMLMECVLILALVMKEDGVFACTDPSGCCVDRCCETGKHGLQQSLSVIPRTRGVGTPTRQCGTLGP